MIRLKRLFVPGSLIAVLALAACAFDPRETSQEPALTPVGSGLGPESVPDIGLKPPPPVYRAGNSIWQDSSADLFRDPRAARVGDLVTVKIAMNDKATFDNKNERNRYSKSSLDSQYTYDISHAATVQHLLATGSGSFKPKADARTETKAKGTIARAETIELRVAAVVTCVMPNGNLIISGSQELRVNFELRELKVQGIVRPRDIAADNSIAYDKIAEARIIYGGRGRITEVQQPAWGQQVIDMIAPW
jgi:flagellar L-ring protein precursor FlgH